MKPDAIVEGWSSDAAIATIFVPVTCAWNEGVTANTIEEARRVAREYGFGFVVSKKHHEDFSRNNSPEEAVRLRAKYFPAQLAGWVSWVEYTAYKEKPSYYSEPDAEHQCFVEHTYTSDSTHGPGQVTLRAVAAYTT